MAMKVQMSDADAVKLINAVKKRPCIWNPNDENYSERYQISVAWDDIATKLDMPEEIIRVKWKNLRDFFKKEVKKNNLENVEEYRGRWRHFKSMGFLIQAGESQGSSEADPTDKTMEGNDECEVVIDNNLEVFLREDPIPEKKFKADEDEDYDMMFLKSLTPFLKQLEPTRNLVVRSRIQEMLLNELAAQNTSQSSFLKKS